MCSASGESESGSEYSAHSPTELSSNLDSDVDRKRKRPKSATQPENTQAAGKGKAKTATPKRKESLNGGKTPQVICFFLLCNSVMVLSDLHCLQRITAQVSDTHDRTGKRKSIKESGFGTTYAEQLKPIYKYYQDMQFAALGHRFPWDAPNRKACVQALLDAAKECHPRETYIHFKKAVEAELLGTDGTLRY